MDGLCNAWQEGRGTSGCGCSWNTQTVGKTSPHLGLRNHPSPGENLSQGLLLIRAQSAPGVSWTFYAQRDGGIAPFKSLLYVCSPQSPQISSVALFYFISIEPREMMLFLDMRYTYYFLY